jgi:hypothetical protein
VLGRQDDHRRSQNRHCLVPAARRVAGTTTGAAGTGTETGKEIGTGTEPMPEQRVVRVL